MKSLSMNFSPDPMWACGLNSVCSGGTGRRAVEEAAHTRVSVNDYVPPSFWELEPRKEAPYVF